MIKDSLQVREFFICFIEKRIVYLLCIKNKTMKQYINPLLRVATVGLLLYVIYNQSESIKELKAAHAPLQFQCDSLKSEIFVKDIDIQRYGIIIDRANEDPRCRRVLNKIFNETE